MIMIGNRVYHYTSVEALMHLFGSVNESKDKRSFVFRASNIFYMNDPQEFLYGIDVLMEVLKEIESYKNIDSSQSLTDFFIRHKEKTHEEWCKIVLDSIRAQNYTPYVISFSKQKDSLPMWLHYGNKGKGACLAFPEYRGNIKSWAKDFPQNSDIELTDDLDVNNVYYSSLKLMHHNDDSSLFVTIEKLYCKLYQEQLISNPPKDLQELQIGVLKALIIVLSPFVKSLEYEGEKEVRIVKSLRRDFGNHLKNLHFRTNSNGNIIPYVNVEIPKSQLDYVIVGPLANFDLTKMALEQMKMKYDLEFDILPSEVKYREY